MSVGHNILYVPYMQEILEDLWSVCVALLPLTGLRHWELTLLSFSCLWVIILSQKTWILKNTATVISDLIYFSPASWMLVIWADIFCPSMHIFLYSTLPDLTGFSSNHSSSKETYVLTAKWLNCSFQKVEKLWFCENLHMKEIKQGKNNKTCLQCPY